VRCSTKRASSIKVRTLAVSDPLTGLANYRRLISVMEAELDRSRRTQRPFSVVLFDMDGLKAINDPIRSSYGQPRPCSAWQSPAQS